MFLDPEIREAHSEGYNAGIAFHLEGAPMQDNPYDTRIVNAEEFTGDEFARLTKLAEAWQDGFELAGEDS
jgi:hypothetical protein